MFAARSNGTGMCASCRRLAQTAAHEQVRGLKQMTKSRSITVRLRKDVKFFGRAGAIVPVPYGMMRNSLYPKQMADYIDPKEVKKMHDQGLEFERDALFGSKGSNIFDLVQKKKEEEADAVPEIDLRTLSPGDCYAILDRMIPDTLDFYRTPIEPSEAKHETAQLDPAQKKAKEAAPPTELSPRQTADNIYGSVSVDDIETAVKGMLNQQGFTGLVVLPEQEIKFVHVADTETDAARIKKLGDYEIEIRIKGHDDVLTRSVRVLPDNGPANQEAPASGSRVGMGGPDVTARAAEAQAQA